MSDYHYQMTWISGVAYIQRCPRFGNYTEHGEIVRKATEQDHRDRINGRISYDPATDPNRLAWEEHVRRGGD